MGRDQLDSKAKRPAHFRLCNVSRYITISYVVVVYASFNSYYYFNCLFFGLVSYNTELLEIRADDPKMHVLFIPGNPGKFGFILLCVVVVVHLILITRIRECLLIVTIGVVTFYKDFVESLYEFLEGNVSITGKTWLLLDLVNLIFYFWAVICELIACTFLCVLITSHRLRIPHEKGTYTWLI
jgi:uncharacterized membrane protein YccF (DUF307 family)